jgi:hypothetical protein
MPSGDKFIRRQDEQLKKFERSYRSRAEAFAKAYRQEKALDEQKELLLLLHRAGTEYFRQLNIEVLNCGRLNLHDYERWKNEWICTVTKNLNELPRYFLTIRDNRERLGFPETTFEPPNGSFHNIQRFFAAACPESVTDLKATFATANLPVDGLDKPHMSEPRSNPGHWRQFCAVAVVLLLLTAFVGAAQFVHPLVLGGIATVVVALFIVISAIDLLRDGKIKEKSFLEIVKLVLAKRFQFIFGKEGNENPPVKPPKSNKPI